MEGDTEPTYQTLKQYRQGKETQNMTKAQKKQSIPSTQEQQIAEMVKISAEGLAEGIDYVQAGNLDHDTEQKGRYLDHMMISTRTMVTNIFRLRGHVLQWKAELAPQGKHPARSYHIMQAVHELEEVGVIIKATQINLAHLHLGTIKAKEDELSYQMNQLEARVKAIREHVNISRGLGLADNPDELNKFKQ